MCLKDTVSGNLLSDVDCTLKGQTTEFTGKTGENGLVAWSELTIGDYTVSIKMGDLKIEKVVFWKNSPNKTQVIKIRQDIE